MIVLLMVGILTVVPSRKRDCVALPAAKHYRKSLLSKTLKILGNIQNPRIGQIQPQCSNDTPAAGETGSEN